MQRLIDALMYPLMAVLILLGQWWGMCFEDE